MSVRGSGSWGSELALCWKAQKGSFADKGERHAVGEALCSASQAGLVLQERELGAISGVL